MAHDVPEAPVGSSPSEQADVTGRSPTDLAGGGHRAGAAEVPPTVPAPETPQPSPEPGKPRKLLYVTLPGCWGALIAGCLSFTPSLLPRGGIVQGLIWGITAAIGYGPSSPAARAAVNRTRTATACRKQRPALMDPGCLASARTGTQP